MESTLHDCYLYSVFMYVSESLRISLGQTYFRDPFDMSTSYSILAQYHTRELHINLLGISQLLGERSPRFLSVIVNSLRASPPRWKGARRGQKILLFDRYSQVVMSIKSRLLLSNFFIICCYSYWLYKFLCSKGVPIASICKCNNNS